jgi:nucleoside phosphorylase
MFSQNKRCIGIFVATQFELEALLGHFNNIELVHRKQPRVYCANKENGLFVFIKVGPGVKTSYYKLEKLVLKYRFDLALVVGFAGALTSELKVGDLVLSYFQGLVDPWKKEMRNRAAMILFTLAQKSSTACMGGGTASSLAFLATPSQKNEFKKLHPECIAVDMENDKVGELFLKHQIPALSLRAISDSFKQSFDWKKWNDLHRLTLKDKRAFCKFSLIHPLQATYFLNTQHRLNHARNKYTRLVGSFSKGFAPLFQAANDTVVARLIKEHQPVAWEN